MGTLTAEEKRDLRAAISKYIPDREELERFLVEDFDLVLDHLVDRNALYPDQLAQLIHRFSLEGKLSKLVDVLLRERAENRKFIGIVQPIADKLKAPEDIPPPPSETVAAATPAQPQAGAGPVPADSKERRIFICYPRELLADVTKFHKTLLERLGTYSRSYRIFRDEGPEISDSIPTGTDWRDVVKKKLEASQCCLLALAPTIFESTECASEADYFETLLEKDPSRFFYPVTFVGLDGTDSIDRHAESGNAIARILKKRNLDIYDFSTAWAESDATRYQAELHKIAKELNYRFRSLSSPTAPAPEVKNDPSKIAGPELPEQPGEREPEQPRWRRWLALGLVAVLAAVGVWWINAAEQPVEPELVEPVFQKASAPIALLAPVDTFTSWNPDRQSAGQLAPGNYTPDAATIDDKVWYRVAKAPGELVYLPKDSTPDWKNASANLDTIGEIQTLKEPKDGAQPARLLQPGDLAFLPKGTSLQLAELDGETWYAVPRLESSSTVHTFFSAADNQTKLVQWTAIDGCLQVSKSTSASLRPLSNDGEGGSLDAAEIIRGEIQKTSASGETLFRFRPPGKEPYFYVGADDVTQTPCES